MKVFTILLILALLLPISSVSIVSVQQPSIKTFVQWCQQRDSLAGDTKYTVDVMIEKAGTKDCKQAERYFNKLTEINLSRTNISDVRPLASLNNLTRLYLISNRINDITPLASLNKLTVLYLMFNRIKDVTPLASLNKLTFLSLTHNQISNLRPLASLIELTHLNIANNPISDLRPLAGLKKLTSLYLDPKFTKKDCPVKLEACIDVSTLIEN